MNEKSLSSDQLNKLRAERIINNEEIVYQSGDLYIAENVITKDRRILKNCEGLMQENRRILKG